NNRRHGIRIHRLVIGLGNDEAMAERRRAVFLCVELERASHQLAKVRNATLAAGLHKELQFITSHAQSLRDVRSGDEVADEDRLLVHEMKSRRAVLAIDLRS